MRSPLPRASKAVQSAKTPIVSGTARHRRPGNTQAFSHFCEKLRAAFHRSHDDGHADQQRGDLQSALYSVIVIQSQEKTVTMAGKVGQATAAAAVSTGGSLISDAKLKQLYTTMVQCRLLTERARRLRGQPRSRASTLLRWARRPSLPDVPSTCSQKTPSPSRRTTQSPAWSREFRWARSWPRFMRAHRTQPIAQRHHALRSQCTQLGLATSVALANKRKKKSNVVVAFSDKATTTLGCWHEALGLAARKSLPIIFVVENNPRLVRPVSSQIKKRRPARECAELRLSHHYRRRQRCCGRLPGSLRKPRAGAAGRQPGAGGG